MGEPAPVPADLDGRDVTVPGRLVVQGLGAHTLETILPAVEASTRWRLAGLVSRRADAAAEQAARFEVPHHDRLEAAIDEVSPDAVYVATEPADHVTSCRVALEAGVGTVFVEKPLAVDAGEVPGLVELARAHGALLCETLAYRFHPQFAALRRAVDSDEFDGLLHGYARFSYPHLAPDNHRYDVMAGGGALLDAGVYPLSLAVALMGDVPLHVSAGGEFGDRGVDISGHATVEDDAGRTFQCSWQMGSAYTNLARLVGAGGSVEVQRPFSKPSSFDIPIVQISGWGERSELPYEGADQFAAMLDAVAERSGDDAFADDMHRETVRRWAIVGEVIGAITRRRPT